MSVMQFLSRNPNKLVVAPGLSSSQVAFLNAKTAAAQAAANSSAANAATTTSDKNTTNANAAATLADRSAVAADKIIADAAKTLTAADRVQTAADRVATGADRAAIASGAAGVAATKILIDAALDDAAALATGNTVIVDTLAELEDNETALTGQVIADGANNGFYGRSTPDDAGTAWIKKFSATLPAIDARVLDIEPAEITAGGYADEFRDSKIHTIVSDRNNKPVRLLCEGWGHAAVSFDVTANGLVRVEHWAKPAAVRRSGTAIVVPRTRIELTGRPLLCNAALVNIAAPAEVTVTDEVRQLAYQSINWLSHQAIKAGSFVSRKTADNTTLLESDGVVGSPDFEVDYDSGNWTGLKNVANFNGTNTFNAYLQRTGFIVANAFTGEMSYVAGTERPRVASMWGPTVPPGCYLAWTVFTWRDKNGVTWHDLTPSHRFRNGIEIGKEAQWLAYAQEFWSRLPRTRRRILEKLALKIGSSGDSTDAHGGAVAADTYLFEGRTPLGGYRDTSGYYGPLMDVETLNKLDAFGNPIIKRNWDFGDGLGPIHTKEGVVWGFVKALEARGIAVTKENFSIPGTSCETGFNQRGEPNLGNPVRWAPMVARAYDALFICIGQNDLDTAGLGEKILAIIDGLRQGVTELVFVLPSARSMLYIGGEKRANYLRVINEIKRACDLRKVAYLDTSLFQLAEKLGAFGFSKRQTAETTLVNHNGWTEQQAQTLYMLMLLAMIP